MPSLTERDLAHQEPRVLIGKEAIEKATEVIVWEIERFRKVTQRPYRNYPPLADRSIALGEAINHESGALGYVIDQRFKRFSTPPDIIGEVILGAMSKFQIELRWEEFIGHEDYREMITTDRVRGEDFAFVRRQKFRDNDWTSITWELVDTAPEFKLPLPHVKLPKIPLLSRLMPRKAA